MERREIEYIARTIIKERKLDWGLVWVEMTKREARTLVDAEDERLLKELTVEERAKHPSSWRDRGERMNEVIYEAAGWVCTHQSVRLGELNYSEIHDWSVNEYDLCYEIISEQIGKMQHKGEPK